MGTRVHHVDLSVRDIAAAEPLYDLVLTHIGYAPGKRYPNGGGEAQSSLWNLDRYQRNQRAQCHARA